MAVSAKFRQFLLEVLSGFAFVFLLTPPPTVKSLLIVPTGNFSTPATNAPLPVVLWHGMGDTCCLPQSMGRIAKLIEKHLPGGNGFVHSLMIGPNQLRDEENGFFKNVNDQIEEACKQLASIPQLAGGYNAVGFSQGGQFLRAVVQRCGGAPGQPRMHKLISIGGQQQGVYGFPNCPGREYFCNIVRRLLDFGAYTGFVQHRLVQAQYWHDPLHEDEYRAKSLFLADVNCASRAAACNSTYKQNLVQLEKFVMIKFLDDNMVQPPESEWFGYYTPDQANDIQSLNETELYKDDLLGLREMDQAGKLVFLSLPGDHLQFTEPWFISEIIQGYLS